MLRRSAFAVERLCAIYARQPSYNNAMITISEIQDPMTAWILRIEYTGLSTEGVEHPLSFFP